MRLLFSSNSPVLLLLLVSTLLLSTTRSVHGAGSSRVKGLKGTIAHHDGASNNERRLKKNKIKGPDKRSCKVESKKNEVEFECKSRSGESSSKDDKGKKGSSDSSDSETATLDGGDDIESRGISVAPEEIKDKIKYKVRTAKEGIHVQIEWKQEIETEEEETKTESEFEVIFSKLVEYVKNSDSDSSESTSKAYDWDTDEIIQEIPLGSWDDIPGVVTNDGDGVVSYFTATTAPALMGAGGGVTSFNFTVSRADQDERITANSMKIDVRIVDFPWTSTDSYVALMSTVESKKKVKVEYDDEATVGGKKSKKTEDITISFGGQETESLGFATFGEYSWEEEAEAQSDQSFNNSIMVGRQGNATELFEETTTNSIQVIATSPPSLGNETFQEICYSFVGEGAQGANNIFWDPSAGVGYESSAISLSAIKVATLGLLGSIAVTLMNTLW